MGGMGTTMAPALTGNYFTKKSSADEIKQLIRNGRAGAAKKYKNFTLSMPPQNLSDPEMSALITYLKALAGHSGATKIKMAPAYLIGPEDVLDIAVWKNPDLSLEVTVRPDGKISMPLVGDIHAGGRTPDELREVIVAKLKEYQETVVASVIVKQVNSYRIFILGEVVNPGSYLIKRRTTVLQAIALAGGFNKYASKNKMVVIRDKKGETEEKIPVRFDHIVDPKARLDTNLTLKPGDTIFVP
jgi:polysaccharide export outer membrane protein